MNVRSKEKDIKEMEEMEGGTNDRSVDLSTRLRRTCSVVVNYQTPDLLERAVRSFKAFYPDVPTIIVDNGSQDNSREVIESLCDEFISVTAVFRDENVGHGPAMHGIIDRGEFDFYFFLDSDTETRRGGFLEEMLREFDDENVYSVGEVMLMNRRGFYDPEGFPALMAAYMLIRSSHYRTLPPFQHHGAPVTSNFNHASRKGYRVCDFPIQSYIDHLHRGTVSRFGYGLGVKGIINYVLNKLGI